MRFVAGELRRYGAESYRKQSLSLTREATQEYAGNSKSPFACATEHIRRKPKQRKLGSQVLLFLLSCCKHTAVTAQDEPRMTSLIARQICRCRNTLWHVSAEAKDHPRCMNVNGTSALRWHGSLARAWRMWFLANTAEWEGVPQWCRTRWDMVLVQSPFVAADSAPSETRTTKNQTTTIINAQFSYSYTVHVHSV